MREPLEPERRRALRRRLELLSAEHRALDGEISACETAPYVDQISVRRLKKRKLLIREEIERLRSALIPDLNA